MNKRAHTVSMLCIALVAVAACRSADHSTAKSGSSDWSGFAGKDEKPVPEGVRVVPETPIEITGVPYVRSIQLSWSESDVIPTFEPANQTLKLPPETRQAVLLVNVVDLPESARIRVDWFYGNVPAFTDSLESRDDGDHYFALVKRDGKRLLALPEGDYHADVYDGQRLLKSVRFQVIPQGARS